MFSIVTMTIFVLLWTIPTIGLLVTSFRTRDDASTSGWWTALLSPFTSEWTTSNYSGAWTGADLGTGFVNSIVVAIPATLIPIMFAAFAAYAFTFMNFPLKEFFFLLIIGVLVVPIQVAFQPMLDIFGPRGLGISGQYLSVWILHTGFGMPLCIYVLRNYMSTLPRSVVESAKIDGCSHFQTFWRLVFPMSIPAIAAFATLQFLWVWNDLLIAKLFLNSANTTVIVKLQQLLGTQGQGAELLTAGAFITMVIPLIVFFALQRFMVRGLTSGAVKG
jgi:alpha-glucoside transport system permease protein